MREILIAVLLWTATGASAQMLVQYDVSFPANEPNRIDVVCEIPQFIGGDVSLRILTYWARAEDLWRNVQDLRVENSLGTITEHTLTPDGLFATLELTNQPEGLLRFTYAINARETLRYEAEPTRNAEYCFAGGRALFLELQRTRRADYWVRFALPDGWRATTSWGHGSAEFHPGDGQALVNSKIALGDYRTLSGELMGSTITLSIRDRWSFSDEALLSSLLDYAHYFSSFFGEFPEDSLVFIINKGQPDLPDGEHTPGVISIAYPGGPETLDPRKTDDYLNSLVAIHELFHLWNGRHLAAEGYGWFQESVNTYNAVVIAYSKSNIFLKKPVS